MRSSRAVRSSTPHVTKRRPSTWGTRRRRPRSNTRVASARRARNAPRVCTSRKKTRSTRSAGSATKSRPKRPRPPWTRKRTSDGELKGRRQAPPRGDGGRRDGLQESARRGKRRFRQGENVDQGARTRQGQGEGRP